jgi:hypothetical protein
MYYIREVKALYPKIDQPYRFDSQAGERGKSVPCTALDDGACFELNFIADEVTAKALHKAMKTAYDEKKQKGWNNSVPRPKKNDDGDFVFKTTIKAAYSGREVPRPKQFDSSNTELPTSFKLTTGSTINIAVEFIPHAMEGGVSLRLKQVQVLKYVPMEARSLFESLDGVFVFEEETQGSLFEAVEEPPEEPKKIVRTKVATSKAQDKDLSSIVDEWDD